KPNPHLETEVLRSQSAYWTDVDSVECVIVVKPLAGIGRKGVVTATVDDAQRVIANNILCKTDAARAQDTPFVVQNDSRPQIDAFGLVHFGFRKPTLGLPKIHRIFLELAFTSLVANRAIQ